MNRVEELETRPPNYNLRSYRIIKGPNGSGSLGLSFHEQRCIQEYFPNAFFDIVNGSIRLASSEGTVVDASGIFALTPDDPKKRVMLDSNYFKQQASPLTVIYLDEEEE